MKTSNPYHQNNLILNLTFEFSLESIQYVEKLSSLNKYVVANQLLKSSTSIGANVREAQNAESKADFIHKMKIAAKEANETSYWLELCEQSAFYPNTSQLLTKLTSISKVLNKIISSAKRNHHIS
ncbi:MAG: four helix bundle protein [Bacteroidia bacterium]